jgi:predicted hotdog family 3-hydroxylacyl-ACP dehydratase
MQCRLDLDDSRLPRSSAFDVLLDDIDAFDDDTVPFDHVEAHFALLAFVPARRH